MSGLLVIVVVALLYPIGCWLSDRSDERGRRRPALSGDEGGGPE